MIIKAIGAGAEKSVKAVKGILIVWFISLIMTLLLTVPFKAAINGGFGRSLITDKLRDGINLEVLGDLVATIKGLTSSFLSGFLVLLIVGILVNIFLSGGLFSSIKGTSERFSSSGFFRDSAKHFWPFVIISTIIYIIILLILIVFVIVPVSIVVQADIPGEWTVFKTLGIGLSIFFLILTLLFLVADNARAWQVSHEHITGFKALGFGFRNTFRTFLSAYPMMLFLIAFQIIYSWFVFRLLSGLKSLTSGGVILLFFLSQFLFFVKILLKVWRYGSITSLMEQNSAKID